MKLHKLDLGVVLSLGLTAFLVRVPFLSQYLYHWDSVNFALSLEHYDVRLDQPHMPGYFLYSMLGRLINTFVQDANTSLVLISLVSGVFGVMAIYWLGSILFDRRIAVLAALLTLTNPMHWFYSDIALSYSVEFLLVTILVGLCYRQLVGFQNSWYLVAILLGVAGGVRQNDLIFLFPLWAVSLSSLCWRKRIGSIGILGTVVVAWMMPMMLLSGGPSGYLAALRGGSTEITSQSSLFAPDQLVLNGVRMAIYLGYSLLLGVVPLLFGLWRGVRQSKSLLSDRRSWVMVLWITPAFCFYIFIHLRQHGHIFTFLPAVILLTALAMVKLTQSMENLSYHRFVAVALTAAVLITNGSFFLLAPASLFGSKRLPLQTPSRQTIVQRDQFLAERINFVRTHFNPESTVILAGGLDFRHPDYYLKHYQFTNLSYSLPNDGQQLPHEIKTLVIFTPDTEQNLRITGARPAARSEQDILPYYVRVGEGSIFVAPITYGETALNIRSEEDLH